MSEATRYRCLQDVVRIPFGGGVLAYQPLDRGVRHLGQGAAALLSRCASWASLDEHAGRLASEALARDRVAETLRSLAGVGLLTSETALREALANAPCEHSAARPPRVLGIPTRGRPDQPGQAARSYADNARRHGHPLEVVFSVGGLPVEQAPVLAALQAARPELGAITVLTHERKRQFAAALAARAGVDEELVVWAISAGTPQPWSDGGERNAVTLWTAGERVLFADDDTRCRLFRPADARPGLALVSGRDPARYVFPDPDQPLTELAAEQDVDYLAAHGALLGRDVLTLVQEAHVGDVELGGASAQLLRSCLAGQARVLWTQVGSLGDVASGSVGFYLLLSGASRQHLLGSEARYRAAFASRQAARCAPTASVVDAPHCLGLTVALDGERLLPPFAPQLRNSDGVFAMLARTIHGGGCAGYLPLMVWHQPPERRSSSLDDVLEGARSAGANDLLCQLVGSAGIVAIPDDPAATMRLVGRLLTSFAEQSLADFDEMLRTMVLHQRSLDIATVDRLLARHRAEPELWAADLRRVQGALVEALEDPEHARAVDLGVERPEERIGALRSYTRRMGQLLAAWPDLWHTARQLRAERGSTVSA